ncbi:uncharacterized protein GBIM_14618 [Gryllus bimaculatus]|nr:uncharacterized protein GBIM_14618 [Gryllus bimaculatus]
MATVKFERVVSYSSEDPKYPAENLLKFGNKWKCKSPGEANATVILQLDQLLVIESIDIGNEHSAFIHVLVGRAASDDYESLLPASSFMSPGESDQSTNTNRVRMFTKKDFLKPTANEKWDRIKIVCSQPFNKRVQYGLSFIVAKGPEDKPKPMSLGGLNSELKNEDSNAFVNLGQVRLKKEADDDIHVESLFAKRKKLSDTIDDPAANGASPKKNAGPILKPTLSPAQQKIMANKVAAKVKDPPTKQTPDPPPKPKFSALNNRPASPSPKPVVPTHPKRPVSPARTKASTKPATQNAAFKIGNQTGKGSPVAAKPTVPSGGGKRPSPADRKAANSTKETKSSVKSKPFSKLLEGVTIVISGITNPARSFLRSKALEMGAKYKQDWDSTCTHLICAFKNTPKFKQVQGHGHIVTKDWIDQCHSKRKRFPWRRFALDINDTRQPESDDEIVEEIPQASTSSSSALPTVSNWEVDTSSGCKAESGSDTEDELERLEAKKVTSTTSSYNPYLSDTDVEDDERPDTSDLPMPPLP